jgi:hypothetical protein
MQACADKGIDVKREASGMTKRQLRTAPPEHSSN